MTKVAQTDLIAGAIAGEVVSFPTDTVPALAVLPEYSASIFALKQRPQNKPLILMGASSEDLWQYVTATPEELAIWQKVVQQYWPGPLTLVLPASPLVPKSMNLHDPTTIGIRVPDQPIAQAILTKTGPLATTSANISGQAPWERMTEIDAAFPEVLVLECDQLETKGKLGSSLPSTVAKWTSQGWQILRQGSILKL